MRLNDEIISVIMGVKYNRKELDTLKRSIDSVLAQTYSRFELIICERGSSVKARKLLETYACSDSRVTIIDGSGTNSFSEQLNMCLKQSKGVWIARMDDDDFSFPERFEKQMAYLKAHKEIAFVGCNTKLVQDGEAAGVWKFPEQPQIRDFLFSMPFVHPTLMFRRNSLEAVDGYSTLPYCERCEDYDLLLRLYEKGFYGANMQEILFAYTLPHNGITTRTFRDRINESKMRYARFRALGLLPGASFYVVKPLAVGLIPAHLLKAMKTIRRKKQ